MDEETAARSWSVRWRRGQSERIQCSQRHDPGGNGCLKILGVERPKGKVLEFLNVAGAPVIYDAQAEDLSSKTKRVCCSCDCEQRRPRKRHSLDSTHAYLLRSLVSVKGFCAEICRASDNYSYLQLKVQLLRGCPGRRS